MAEDRDKYETEATEKNQNYYAVIEDVKLADLEIVDVQRQIIEVNAKLKSQQKMCVPAVSTCVRAGPRSGVHLFFRQDVTNNYRNTHTHAHTCTHTHRYEAVRSDRNLYSKSLLEAQEQVVVMKRKFQILTHAIAQLQQEIVTKDQHLVKEHFAHHRVENEIQMLRNDLTRIRKQIQSSEQIISNQVRRPFVCSSIHPSIHPSVRPSQLS